MYDYLTNTLYNAQVFWPRMLRVSGLSGHNALARGYSVGAVSHVMGMAALTVAGHCTPPSAPHFP
jgi:putative effector of murein hydrolase